MTAVNHMIGGYNMMWRDSAAVVGRQSILQLCENPKHEERRLHE